MRTPLVLASLAVATATLVGVAAPAQAAKPRVELIGTGTWSTGTSSDDAGATFTGESSGFPISGVTTGSIRPNDGTNPPWPGCEPSSGTLTTTSSDGRSLTVEVWGDLCTAVHPDARLVFTGWYDVTQFDGGKGRRTADGRGSLDIRTFADGTLQWMVTGNLY